MGRARVRRLDRERRAESIIRQHLAKINRLQEEEKKKLNEAAVREFVAVSYNYFSEHGVSDVFDNHMEVWANNTYTTPVPQLLMRFVRIVAGDARLDWDFVSRWFVKIMETPNIVKAHPKMSLEVYEGLFVKLRKEA